MDELEKATGSYQGCQYKTGKSLSFEKRISSKLDSK